MKEKIYELQSNIENVEDFSKFLKEFIKNFEDGKEWENIDINNFLNGFEGYIFDKKPINITWRILAEILLAARVYE